MTATEIFQRLAEPFPAAEVEFKPARVSGERALALCYLTARGVMDRLDDVLGPGHWRDEYMPLVDGGVECRLSLRVDGEWLTKIDVGSPSEQPDAGDRTKAAYSDALKRAAVKWGVGRYLYFLDQFWVGYDAQKKRLVEEPRLPAWALPGGSGRPFKAHPAASAKLRAGYEKDLADAKSRGAVLDVVGRVNGDKEAHRLTGDDLAALRTLTAGALARFPQKQPA